MVTSLKKTKRLLSILLCLCMVLSILPTTWITASAVKMSGGEVLYLKPNSNWVKDGARFAAYFFGSGNTWASMTPVETGIYKVTVPDGNWTNVIFCRMNPANPANNWDNKWNQSGDLEYNGTENLCAIKAGQWDCGTNVSWSAYEESPCTHDSHTQEGNCTNCGVAVEHVYVDGFCSCGAEDPTEPVSLTVYCINSLKWAEVSAHAWGGGAADTAWPGIPMTKTEETVNGFDIYEVTFDVAYESVLFNNNNNGSQSDDLELKDGQYYDLKNKSWYASLEEVPVIDPLATDCYLAGGFNGWNTTANEFKRDAEGSVIGYISLELEANTTYEFKVVSEGVWTSCQMAITGDIAGLNFSNTVNDNCTITTKEAGVYVFAFGLDNSQLSVTYPTNPDAPCEHVEETVEGYPATCTENGLTDGTKCALCGETLEVQSVITAPGHSFTNGKCDNCDTEITVTLPGSFNGWNEKAWIMTRSEDGIYTYEVELDADSYSFKIMEDGNWFGNTGTITDHTEGVEWIFDGSSGDCTLNASGGTYTFIYNINTKGLKVEAALTPTYTITFTDLPNLPDFGFGEWSYTITKPYGAPITEEDLAGLEAAMPESENYVYLWYSLWEDGTGHPVEIPATMPDYDLNIYAYWEGVSSEVSFYTDPSMDVESLLTASCFRYGETYENLEQFIYANGLDNDAPEGYHVVAVKYADGTDMVFPYVHGTEALNLYVVLASDACEHVEETVSGYGATCTEPGLTDGVKCSVCGETLVEQEEIPAPGHDFVDDVCSVCGAAKYMTIYFQNNWLWSDVKLHFWGSEYENETEWPGASMTFHGNDGTYDCYSLVIPTDVDGIIVNGIKDGGSGARDQTPNIESGWYDGICYYMTWDNGNQTGSFDIGDIEFTCQHKDDDDNGLCDTCQSLLRRALLRMTSISLKGNIAINYYMMLSDEVLNDDSAYMQFTLVNGNEFGVSVKDAVPVERDGVVYYVFSCEVNAKEMTDVVLSQFFYEGGETAEHSYTVQTYAKHIIEKSNSAKAKALVTAMLNYGAASQVHFGYHTDNLANAGLEAPDYSNVTIDGFKADAGQGTDLAKLYSASLILKSETTLRFFFKVDSGVENFSVLYGTETLEVKERGGLYYVDVTGISAKDLDADITLTVNDGGNTADVVFNPMSYCQGVQNDTTGAFGENMKNLVAALYQYNLAADNYFEEN